MFAQRQNRTLLGAAGSTLMLIHAMAAHSLRKQQRNPVMVLVLQILQTALLILVFRLAREMLSVGSRNPIRGDFIIFVMSGIFMYQVNVGACGAVSGSGGMSSGLLKHGPMNAAVLISAAALASLYKTVLSGLAVLGIYYVFVPFELEDPVACLGMLVFCWAQGCSVGLIFLGIRPWNPALAGILTTIYVRANLLASGKFFVANMMPNFMLMYFDWNPLFHIVDQTRGFAFINYTPHKSSLEYPFYVMIACVLVGLMIEFTTRKQISISWSAGR